jgi:hypothetical protein
MGACKICFKWLFLGRVQKIPSGGSVGTGVGTWVVVDETGQADFGMKSHPSVAKKLTPSKATEPFEFFPWIASISI